MQEVIKSKGFREILEESPSLLRKITYEEYADGKAVPQNSDEFIENAYANYKKVKYGQE
ncbi:MAG: hypothetical protein K2N44_17715 [Lachnospiraceae bacterium]|nr:hypothetical protein [Lachnospiraceae bacterium]